MIFRRRRSCLCWFGPFVTGQWEGEWWDGIPGAFDIVLLVLLHDLPAVVDTIRIDIRREYYFDPNSYNLRVARP